MHCAFFLVLVDLKQEWKSVVLFLRKHCCRQRNSLMEKLTILSIVRLFKAFQHQGGEMVNNTIANDTQHLI